MTVPPPSAPERSLQEDWRGFIARTHSDRTRGNGLELKEGGLDWVLGKNSLL